MTRPCLGGIRRSCAPFQGARIHLILGVLVFMAGFAVMRGAVWGRTLGVIIAVVSILTNFAWLPYYPLWGLVMIVANSFVIWALTAHGRDVAA